MIGPANQIPSGFFPILMAAEFQLAQQKAHEDFFIAGLKFEVALGFSNRCLQVANDRPVHFSKTGFLWGGYQ